jgi:hypothetical protein
MIPAGDGKIVNLFYSDYSAGFSSYKKGILFLHPSPTSGVFLLLQEEILLLQYSGGLLLL